MELTIAQLADKYRNQRDALAEALVAIVNEDAKGQGFYAAIAQKGLERMAATTHDHIPHQDGSRLT